MVALPRNVADIVGIFGIKRIAGRFAISQMQCVTVMQQECNILDRSFGGSNAIVSIRKRGPYTPGN